MDFVSIGKVAIELGVIPAVALFLVVAMHAQNKKLTAMLERKDEHTFEILTMLVADLAELRKSNLSGRQG